MATAADPAAAAETVERWVVALNDALDVARASRTSRDEPVHLGSGSGQMTQQLVEVAAETAFARKVGLELLGADKVMPHGPAQTASEDFAFMLEKVPGSYLVIGNGDGDSPGACMVHNPGYDFNDDNVAVGAAYWTLLAERFLVD